MNILALDAACGAAAACLIDRAGQISHAEGGEGLPHSQAILPLLEGLLKARGMVWQDLEMLALGIGPGSFTGVRVAAATMAGINAGLKLPMLPLSSLAISAAQADTDAPVWVFEDARAREVFVGQYRRGGALREDACVGWEIIETLTPSQFIAHAEPAVAMTEWRRLTPRLARGVAMAQVAMTQAEALGGELPAHYQQPAYLQISQAERSARHG